MDRCTHLALAAARQAEADSALDVRAVGDRAGVAVGTAMGGVGAFEEAVEQLYQRGPRRLSPFRIVQILPNLPAGWVSIELGARGPLLTESTACAASTMAIGDGLDAIRLGRADVMCCGGTEAPVIKLGVAGFAAMRAVSQRNDDPEHASRPFDRDRDGFIVGEGSGMLILEEYERARQRGARIYAEVVGYGMSADAYHITAPSEDGDGPFRVMGAAMRSADVRPDEVQ